MNTSPRRGLFDPEIEAMPWVEVQNRAFRSLGRQVERLYAINGYYRDKFDTAGFHPQMLKDFSDLASIPFFTKDEERISQETVPPFGGHLCVGRHDVMRVQASSGTTGVPTFFALTANDVGTWDRIMARTYFTMGLRREDTYAALSNLSLFAGGVPSLSAAALVGATVLPIGTGIATNRALELAKLLGATVLGLTPSYALYLGEELESHGVGAASDFGLTRLLIGGEPGGQIPGLRARIEELWQCPARDVMGIGEFAGAFWAESDDLAGMHFCGQREIFLEVVDPESGRSVDLANGAVGELVYSAIERDATPLIRYRSGDVVEVSLGPVPSGRTSPRVKVLGRSDDMLIVRGVNVYPSAVRDVVASHMPATTGHIRIVAGEGTLAPSPLPVLVEVASDMDVTELRRRLLADMRSRLSLSADIRFVYSGALPRTELKTQLLLRRPLADCLAEYAPSLVDQGGTS